MKLYIKLLFFLILIFPVVNAQDEKNPVDFDIIRDNISNRFSDSYYPKLMKRYQENDTTLTESDFRNLYYGYTLQEDYNPYRISHYSVIVKDFASATVAEKVQCDSLIKYGELAVADFPFDIRSMNLLIYGYKCKKDEEKMKYWAYKLTGIIDAILSTGDGNSADSPIQVIYAPHEYEVIHRFGLNVKSNTLMPPNMEFIEVEDNKFNIEGYYFDISRVLEVYDEKFAH